MLGCDKQRIPIAVKPDEFPKKRRGWPTGLFTCNSWVFVIVGCVISLAVPVLITLLIRLADRVFLDLELFRLESGDAAWLGFWGSYLGCLATVFLSIMALMVGDRINRYTAERNTAEDIEKFKNFQVDSVLLHNLRLCYPGFQLEAFESYSEEPYFMEVEFAAVFPPQYEICVEKVYLEYRQANNEGNISLKTIEVDNYQLVQNEGHTLLYYLLDAHDDLRRFYDIFVAREPWRQEESSCWLTVRMQGGNNLFKGRRGYYRKLRVTLKVKLKNGSKSREDGAICLDVVDCNLECEAMEGYGT